jgi:hypothetical protein
MEMELFTFGIFAGGLTVGPAASKANESFPFVMLSVFIVIAVISRIYK